MTGIQHRTLTPDTAAMLRAARKAKGWTLVRAADHIGMNFSYLSHLERGNRAPSTALAVDIIYALGLNQDQARALMAESVAGVGRDKSSKRNAAAKATAN